MMVNGLAPVIAPLIGGQLLLFTTWRVIFVILAIFSAILLVGSLLFRESLPKEKRVTGGVATATKNYITLIKDKRFLGQTLIQFFAFGGFLRISQVHPLYTKTSSNYLHKNLAISLVSIAVVLS